MKPASPETPQPDPLALLVDELGSLEKELAPLAPKIARAEQLRKAVRTQTPDTVSEAHGERFVALLGPHGNKTVVDFAGLAKRIGAESFAKFATATLEQLEKNVKPGILAFFLKTEATGPRSLKVLEKGRAA